MPKAKRALPLPTARLLTLAEAASYCSVTTSVFERTCPVVPISLAPDGREDRRLLRYDVFALNEWIDMLGGRLSNRPEHRDWLAKFE